MYSLFLSNVPFFSVTRIPLCCVCSYRLKTYINRRISIHYCKCVLQVDQRVESFLNPKTRQAENIVRSSESFLTLGQGILCCMRGPYWNHNDFSAIILFFKIYINTYFILKIFKASYYRVLWGNMYVSCTPKLSMLTVMNYKLLFIIFFWPIIKRLLHYKRHALQENWKSRTWYTQIKTNYNLHSYNCIKKIIYQFFNYKFVYTSIGRYRFWPFD